MPVSRAMREIDSQEYTDWMAYFAIEPFGERVADMRMGMLAATMANIHRNPKTTPAPYEPAAFIPWAFEAPKSIEFPDPKDQAQFVALAVFGVDLAAHKGKRKRFVVKRKTHG